MTRERVLIPEVLVHVYGPRNCTIALSEFDNRLELGPDDRLLLLRPLPSPRVRILPLSWHEDRQTVLPRPRHGHVVDAAVGGEHLVELQALVVRRVEPQLDSVLSSATAPSSRRSSSSST